MADTEVDGEVEGEEGEEEEVSLDTVVRYFLQSANRDIVEVELVCSAPSHLGLSIIYVLFKDGTFAKLEPVTRDGLDGISDTSPNSDTDPDIDTGSNPSIN